MYLLDTSYLIDLVRGRPQAIELARRMDEEKAYIAISVVTYHEYMLGVYLSHWREKNRLIEKLRQAEVELARFDVLPYTIDIAKKTAEILAHLLKEGKPLGLADIIVAATAIIHKLKLVTRNIEHFSRIPDLRIEAY